MKAYLNKNIKIILNYIVGPLVFCLLVYSIYRQISHQPQWRQSLYHIADLFHGGAIVQLALVLLLMLMNWGLEARKWQVALGQTQKISFGRSLKAIFSGTTLAFFTPNRMGEYLGRILYIEPGRRLQAVSLTIVCSLAQLLVTLLAGIPGVIIMKSFLIRQHGAGAEAGMNLLLVLTGVSTLLLTLFYCRLPWLGNWLAGTSFLRRYAAFMRVLTRFNAVKLVHILSLSALRYLVFVVQYYLLFRIFEVHIGWWQVLGAVSVIFLVLAIVPTIAVITELGVRWKASIELVQFFSNNLVGILAVSLAVWIINLVIPALVGSLLILGIRVFDTNKK